MSILSLPDIAGMLIMMGLLLWLRVQYRDSRVDLWMIGLTFILIETVAVAVFRSKAFTQITHVIALDAYVLAGVSFSWATRKDSLPGKLGLPLSIVPAIPLLAIATIYGLDVTSRIPYLYVGGVSLAAGIGYVWLKVRGGLLRRTVLLGIHLGIWAPVVLFAMHGQLRWMVYWGLTGLYLLVAFSFRGVVRRDRIGGLVIVTGFVIWAMCFLLHPVARPLPEWNGVLQEIWNMQKFFVILGMVLVLLEEQTRRLHEEAMHDALTGLPNRRLFEDRLTQALERSRRTGMSAALFVLDLDGFKSVNDTLGHMAGDLVLVSVADALRSKVRGSDTLARFGGDEFSIVVNDLVRSEDCERIKDALRSTVEGIILPSGARDHLTVSIGYALFPNDAQTASSLNETADAKMYEQKSHKRELVSR